MGRPLPNPGGRRRSVMGESTVRIAAIDIGSDTVHLLIADATRDADGGVSVRARQDLYQPGGSRMTKPASIPPPLPSAGPRATPAPTGDAHACAACHQRHQADDCFCPNCGQDLENTPVPIVGVGAVTPRAPGAASADAMKDTVDDQDCLCPPAGTPGDEPSGACRSS